MTVELRKPMIFEVANHVGDDNDNSIYRWIMLAYSFEDIAKWHVNKTVAEYTKDPNVELCSDNEGDDTVAYVMFDRNYTCETCWGTGKRCPNMPTHDAYTAEDYPFVGCSECDDCRSCDGAGSGYIPLHDDLYLEDTYPYDGTFDVPEWHDLTVDRLAGYQ